MSSVLPLAASLLVGSTDRVLLSVGRNTGQDFGAAALAARPANAAPGLAFAALLPSDPAAVGAIDAANNIALAAATRLPAGPFVTAAIPVAAVHDTPIALPAADIAATAVLPLVAETIVAPSQAAYAYAQMMQIWLESRSPRPVAARTAPNRRRAGHPS